MSTPPTSSQQKQIRVVRGAIAGMGLLSLLTGLGLYVFAERIGLDESTARLIITAFVAAAVVDGLMLYFWDRLFGS